MATLASRTGSSIAAYFSSESAAHNAVSELEQAGFTSSQIGYARRTSEAADADYPSDYATTTERTTSTSITPGSTTAATTKARVEGTWDKIKNFFEGSSGDVEPYADESARGSSVSHEITRAQTPAAYGAGAYDDYDPNDLHGTFSNLDIPDQHSRYFGHRLGSGNEGAVVTVLASGRENEAQEILTRNGGDIGANANDYNYAGTDVNSTDNLGTGGQRIQLLGEVLRVHKDRISRGEVRLRKEVVSEQQTIQVPVTREELVLERVAGDGTTPVRGTIGDNSEIRVPLTEERASVDKQTVVREEVAVGKRAVEEVRDLNSDVSHEELRVDNSVNTTRGKDI